MHVIFGDVRQFIIHHMRQLFDVEAARRNIRRHQDAHVPLLEICQRLRARALAFVAVNGGGADAVLRKLLAEPIRAMFGAREDEHLPPILRRNQMGKQFALAGAVNRMHDLLNDLDGGIARGNFNQHRRIQQAVGKAFHLV